MNSLKTSIDEKSPPSGMATRIIAIDGCGGAGKSTLAAELARKLNNCSIVHTDDFASPDNPINWYHRMLSLVLEPLGTNRKARYQIYSWEKAAMTDWLEVQPQDYLILEGVGATRREFRPFLTYSIFVETPADTRLKRGLERDGKEATEQWESWMRDEDNYVQEHRPKGYADMIIDGTKPFELEKKI